METKKKIALLHRHPPERIRETNAAFPYLQAKGIDVLTFKTFPRTGNFKKHLKSFFWIFYAPLLVIGKGYDVIYCDDSYPFYPFFVKLVSPFSKVIIRLGDLHLMYYFSGIVYEFLHFFEQLTWCFVDRIIVISEAMRDYVGCADVVLDPVDPKDFPISTSDNYGTVMFHGLLVKNKNVDILIKAALIMADTIFIVAGDGPDKERLEKLSPRNVVFLGWVPFKKIPDLIRNCAVGVALRSDNPGNEYVVTSPFLQYGVMGKPCLVTRRKVFGDYPWQFSDVDEMVTKLNYLLDSPEEGETLRQFVLENHRADKIAEEIWFLLSA